jgi:hypothetical protein
VLAIQGLSQSGVGFQAVALGAHCDLRFSGLDGMSDPRCSTPCCQGPTDDRQCLGALVKPPFTTILPARRVPRAGVFILLLAGVRAAPFGRWGLILGLDSLKGMGIAGFSPGVAVLPVWSWQRSKPPWRSFWALSWLWGPPSA